MKFYIKTMGCKTNQTETQMMAHSLINSGYIEDENPDIYIINSCAVTSHALDYALRLAKQIKKQNKNTKVVLAGCGAQTNEVDSPYIDLCLGNGEKLDIVNYLNELSFGKKNIISDIMLQENYINSFVINPNQTRPPVKIQDGCNNRCSYCIIPFLRGKSRSNSIENIIEQINFHTASGIKEIVLTGIHIGQWGLEFNKKLLDLLIEIEKTDIFRYRLGSLYINEIDDDMLEFLINSKKFCPHFHLSLQSLCDKTLKNMNRFYTKNEALNLINKLHQNFNLPYIGCDIITGFNFEDEIDFKITKEALIEANVSYIHSFPFSQRKGTKAYNGGGKVLEHVKKERTKELIDVSNKLHKNFLDKNKNTIRTIIYEKKGKNGLYTGVSENYIKVYKKSDLNIRNTVETVNLSEFKELY